MHACRSTLEDPTQARSSPGCIDDESLAAYVDGRLDPAERRAVELHASQCSRCRDLLVETAAFVEQDARAHKALPFRVTWKETLVAAALAAGVVLLVRVTFLTSRQQATASRPELAGLVAAAAHEPTRLVEGRLTGGFAYKPPPVPTRGANDRSISPELKIAAAQIEQGAKRRESAASDAALGTSYLAVGNIDNAVDYLETAVQEHPDDARYQNDLSVAYIARATAAGRADDWPKALAAAERAAARDPHLVEACFNRALALEGMTLASDAADAWTACAQADAGSPWAAEARSRADAIRARLNAPGSKPHSRQLEREEIEDRLLVKWAEAETRNDHANAGAVLDKAEAQARALAEQGDTMPVDEIALIRRTPHGSSARAALATAHLAYGRARAAFLREALGEASTEMSAAEQSFAAAGSPYKYWGPIFRAIPLWIQGSTDASLRELASIPLDRLPMSYYHLRGRVAWTRAMAFQTASSFDRARTELEVARDLFRRAGELEYESVNTFYLAETEWFLGNRQRLWQLELDAIRHVDDLPAGSRQRAILWSAAVVAEREGYPETGLALLQHLIHLAHAEGTGGPEPDDPNTYLRRGELYGRLNDDTAALADFSRAETAAARVPDQRLHDWIVAEINTARSEVLVKRNPVGAIVAADSALSFHQRTSGVGRLSELLVLRGRAREATGDIEAAAREYDAAISALEHDENSVTAPDAQKNAFDLERVAVREAVRLAAVTRGDTDGAVGIAERGRARVLRKTLSGTAEAAALNPTMAHRGLPKDVSVVYYVTLPDRVLGWLFTNNESVSFTVPIDSARLQLTVRRLDRRIAADAVLDDVREDLRALQPLVEPVLSHVPPGATLVVVPDIGLARIPFSALRDERGAPLITSHPLVFAPSFTTFMMASQRLARFAPDGVVAIGDGHDPKLTGLPRLPNADAEAAAVSRLYPRGRLYTGAQATINKFLIGGEPVIHFAGHTIANPEFPQLSQLLFAADAGTDSGLLLASRVTTQRFANIAVVVLASCESAAGKFIPGEGFDSVARMFLDAGVPSVVASMWPVDDDQSSLLIEFHRQLRATHDVARALRAAQLIELRNDADSTPLRRWAGFVAVGGIRMEQARQGVNQ